MTVSELQILLSTQYQGAGATKMIADLDKISASGAKTAGALKMTSNAAAQVFSNVSAATRARNPQLFTGGGAPPIQPPNIPPQTPAGGAAPGGGGAGGGGNNRTTLGQFGYRFASSFGLGRAAALGGAAGLAGAGAAILVKEAIALLKKTFDEFVKTFSNAASLYSKALQSGTGLNFTSRREGLASVLGVSSKDVYQFGQAVLFLQPRLQFATSILAKTAPNLAATAYEFRILKMNIEALFASMANDAAPELRKFADGLSQIVKAIEDFNSKHHAGSFIAGFIKGLFPSVGVIAGAGKDSGPAPNPLAYMKQIQASAWERLGLVIGGMGGNNAAQETARNTKETAMGIKQLVRAAGVKGGAFYDPFAGSQSYF